MASPEPIAMFDNIYTEEHPRLAEQREAFAEYISGFEGAH
jgi:pyruvate dehydrogenase E1 component alpha subunit